MCNRVERIRESRLWLSQVILPVTLYGILMYDLKKDDIKAKVNEIKQKRRNKKIKKVEPKQEEKPISGRYKWGTGKKIVDNYQ